MAPTRANKTSNNAESASPAKPASKKIVVHVYDSPNLNTVTIRWSKDLKKVHERLRSKHPELSNKTLTFETADQPPVVLEQRNWKQTKSLSEIVCRVDGSPILLRTSASASSPKYLPTSTSISASVSNSKQPAPGPLKEQSSPTSASDFTYPLNEVPLKYLYFAYHPQYWADVVEELEKIQEGRACLAVIEATIQDINTAGGFGEINIYDIETSIERRGFYKGAVSAIRQRLKNNSQLHIVTSALQRGSPHRLKPMTAIFCALVAFGVNKPGLNKKEPSPDASHQSKSTSRMKSLRTPIIIDLTSVDDEDNGHQRG